MGGGGWSKVKVPGFFESLRGSFANSHNHVQGCTDDITHFFDDDCSSEWRQTACNDGHTAKDC